MNTALWSHWGWPLATAVLVTIFTVMVFVQYAQRRKPHQLWWGVGLAFYAIAAYMEAYSEYTARWDPFVYRFYVVFAASLVGFLGLGTLYLIARNRLWPRIGLVYFLSVTAIFLAGSLTAQLDLSQLQPGVTVGGKALGPSLSFPRVCSLFINIPGTILLLGGAVLSVYRFARRREWAYRMWANVLIAIGTLIIAAAGSMARAGTTAGLYPGEMLGAAFLFAGFLMAGTLEKGAAKVRDRMSERAS